LLAKPDNPGGKVDCRVGDDSGECTVVFGEEERCGVPVGSSAGTEFLRKRL